MAWPYIEAVDRINTNGGFLDYAAYSVWRERAGEIDSGVAMIGDQWLPLLNEDLNNGFFDYNKGYLPLYDIFVLGKLAPLGPGPGNGTGAIPTVAILLLLAVVLITSAKK